MEEEEGKFKEKWKERKSSPANTVLGRVPLEKEEEFRKGRRVISFKVT